MRKSNLLILLAALLLNSCHVGRFFVYNFANISDYKKFRERTITKSSIPFEFEMDIDSSAIFHEHSNKYFNNQTALNSLLSNNKTVAFIVIQNDKIKYQWFADKWSEDDIVTSFSMSKSMISAMIGIALEDGAIKSLDEPITNYIKSFKKEGFDKITIQHLLDMRTGIDYNESYVNPFGNVAVGYYGRNLDRHISNLKIKQPAGQEFEYISIATQLLGVIIEEATGKTVSAYFEEKIWKQIGTTEDASWSVDRKNGREKSFCCVNAVAYDFAKFARLYLNLGNWNGTQVIPEEWVKNSIQIQPNTEDQFYQNQWWLFGPSNPNTPNLVTYAAQGHLGQVMYTDPAKDLIILRFGKSWGKASWISIMRSIGKGM